MKHVFIILLSLVVSQSKTYAEELHGIFMVVKGDVEVESPKTGKFKAKVSSKVYAGDTVSTSAEGRGKIVMSDRNVLNLSPDTKLTINKYENDSTSGVKNVEISLEKGKLRSNVEQKYDGEKSQFMIKTPTAVAGVRGTQFLTSFNPSTKQTQIVTFKGAVALSIPGSSAPPVIVKKGQSSSATQGQAAPEAPKQMKKEDLDRENKSSNSAKADSSSGEGQGQKRGVASEGGNDQPKDQAKDSKMIDKSDTNTKLANEIPKAPNAPDAPVPQGPPRPLPRTGPPTINPDIVRNISNKTKVIIVPKVQQ